MEHIIGRDAKTRQLSVSSNGQVKRVGVAGSVPMDVSRQHISLKSLGNGKWQIQNLNAQNVTFVNGLSVESKVVSETDRVELGASHFLFSWDAVRTPKEETVDIRPLRKVWEEYDAATTEAKLSHQKMQNYQKLTGILSTCGILFMFANELGYMRYVLTAFSVSIAIFSLLGDLVLILHSI